MKRNLIILILVLTLLGAWYVLVGREKLALESGPILIDTVSYLCDSDRVVSVAYFESRYATEAESNEIPKPTGSVEVSINGAASSTLAQTISASGIRYANEDESLVFWSKGDGAFIMRDGTIDPEYANCLAAGLSQYQE